jgi:lipid-binding SYLF domain-containing protein
MRVIKIVIAGATSLLVASTSVAELSKHEIKRLNESTAVLTEIRSASDSGIPEQIWSKAECIVVIPSLKKAGFVLGGEFGSGVMSCRDGAQWSPPVFMQLTKASAGLQAGFQSSDLVLVVMNRRGVEKLLTNKVTLGADASVAAGPVGRSASAATDAQLTAEMLSYSRSKGLFAGINLSGGALKPDDSANERAYGSSAAARQIALGQTHVAMAPEAQTFTNALSRDVRATSGVK